MPRASFRLATFVLDQKRAHADGFFEGRHDLATAPVSVLYVLCACTRAATVPRAIALDVARHTAVSSTKPPSLKLARYVL